MSTPLLDGALSGVQTTFRKKIVDSYVGCKTAFRKRDYDTVALRAGHFCEAVARYLQESLLSSHTPFGTKLPDFVSLCRTFEQTPTGAGHESLRILIPRSLSFTYTLRNKRGGHIGGDLDANAIDSATIVKLIDWCVAELIRVGAAIPAEEAQTVIDLIAQREIPAIWSGAGGKRVLKKGLTRAQEVLVLLYSESDAAVPVEDLSAWVEAPRLSEFVERIVLPLHNERCIEFDRDSRTVLLLPPGEERAEAILAA